MNFKGRDFLTLLDYTEEEILYLIELAGKFKKMKQQDIRHDYFRGKNIAILFEKTSTRTRCSFEVAAYDLGLGVTFIDPISSQLGHKESIADTARVLCRMYNGIEYRGFKQELVEELAENSSVPVWNGLTDSDHPTQMLADFMTLKEHFGYIKGLHFSHYGDIRNNTSRALMIASAKLGVHLSVCGPKELWPEEEFLTKIREIASLSGGSITVTDDVEESVKDADVFYTDVWLSMGEDPELWKQRIELLLPYQLNGDLIKKGKDTAVVMHPLPSFHNDKTKVGMEIKEKYGISEMEISDEAFEHERNIIFDQAENRMHTIKAVIYATLSDNKELWKKEEKGMKAINNYSEIAPLKTILLHRPGNEYLNLTPNTLQRLLFDDIPYLKVAQEEHDKFADALRREGVEVVYLVDLVAEALDTSKAIRKQFIRQFIKEGGVTDTKIYNAAFKLLNSIKDNRALGAKCNAGTHISELGLEKKDPILYYRSRDRRGDMVLDPSPNSYAPRDPFITIGNSVILPTMWATTRKRETIQFEYILKYHPMFKDVKVHYGRYEQHSIEGGDVQVMNKETIIIGCSERTEPEVIEKLAKSLFNDPDNTFKTIIAFDMPDEGECMHLDTVMTRVDYDKFAVVQEVADVSKFYVLTEGKNKKVKITLDNLPLKEILKKYLHLKDVVIIKCGNGNTMDSERERFSDGVNFLCVRPGVVLGYDRNFVTNQALRDHGVKVLEIPSSELVNGRGGPHCLSMALIREDDKSVEPEFDL